MSISENTKEETRIFLSPPHAAGNEMELIGKAIDSNYIAPAGPMLVDFEEKFSQISGFKYCLALSSGTAALHLALRCSGITKGDDVWTPSLTFIGGVAPILYQDATPVFLDVDPKTWNLDPNIVADSLNKASKNGTLPKAIMPTDLYGQSCDIDTIAEICSPYNIPIIIDSAESVGASYKDRFAGKGAVAAAYSFNGNKIITSSGGGILASDDKNLIDYARNLSQQARLPVSHYEHREYGYNYRMSNIVAAIGLAQLGVLNDRVNQRRHIFKTYKKSLSHIKGISFMQEADYGRSNRWLTVIQLDKNIYPKGPEHARLWLEERNIESRRAWKPMHLQPVFSDCKILGGGKVSENIWETGLCLPSGTAMSTKQISYIIDKITEYTGLPQQI